MKLPLRRLSPLWSLPLFACAGPAEDAPAAAPLTSAGGWERFAGGYQRPLTREEQARLGLGAEARLVAQSIDLDAFALYPPSARAPMRLPLADAPEAAALYATMTMDGRAEPAPLRFASFASEGSAVVVGRAARGSRLGPGGLAGLVESDQGERLVVLAVEPSLGVSSPDVDLDLLLYAPAEAGPKFPNDKGLTNRPPAKALPLALIGELTFCEKNHQNWGALLHLQGALARAGFRGRTEAEDAGVEPVLAFAGCMFTGHRFPPPELPKWQQTEATALANALDRAKACTVGAGRVEPALIDSKDGTKSWVWSRGGADDPDGVDCVDGEGHPYPFTNCAAYIFDAADPYTYDGATYKPNYGACFRDKAWTAVDYARTRFEVPPLRLVQVITADRNMLLGLAGDLGPGLSTQAQGWMSAQGWAWKEPGDELEKWERAGASVAGFDGLDFATSPHELAHSLNATHDDAPSAEPIDGCADAFTLMHSEGGVCNHNFFSAKSVAEIRDCVAENGLDCPRIGAY